jgi:hypothetical protein
MDRLQPMGAPAGGWVEEGPSRVLAIEVMEG